MTIEQCEQRNKAVIKAWKEWKSGKNYLDNLDCAIVCEIVGINYPLACQRYLESTSNPNSARITTTSRKTLDIIYNFLDTLAKAELPT